MKIAIARTDKYLIPDGWIRYCKENGLDYYFVNPYSSNLIEQLKDCSVFLWYIYHTEYKDMLFSKQLFFSLGLAGIKVFPDYYTSYYFDDKLGQKYVFECLDIPHIPTYVFYSKDEAINWVNRTSFPKVFKLRGGAGGRNVLLIKTRQKALDIIKKAFSCGLSQTLDKKQYFKDQIYMIKKKQRGDLEGVLKGVGAFFVKSEYAKMHGNDKGYVLFQDFVDGNNFDIRVIVIGDRAYGMKRMTRNEDFRASGSGNFVYDAIPSDIIKIAFISAEKMKLQSVAFDFMYNEGKPVIVEMSYGFGTKGSSKCNGYWDRNLLWHSCKPDPYYWQLDDIISKL